MRRISKLAYRLSDRKLLHTVAECGDEIFVEELFPFADGGPTPRALRMWHPKRLYALAAMPQRRSEKWTNG